MPTNRYSIVPLFISTGRFTNSNGSIVLIAITRSITNSNTSASINKIELPIAKGITFNSILNNSILNNNLAIIEDNQTAPTAPIAELLEDNTKETIIRKKTTRGYKKL
jgi:hypothetical protein